MSLLAVSSLEWILLFDVFAIGLIVGGSLIGVLGDRFNKVSMMATGMLWMGETLFISGLLSPLLFFYCVGRFRWAVGPIFFSTILFLFRQKLNRNYLGEYLVL
ncbi:hypothetical protein [Cytobacillus kochii]